MIDKKDIVNLNFLKKEACTGSYQGMRYKIELVGKVLIVSIWAGLIARMLLRMRKSSLKNSKQVIKVWIR